MKCPKCSYLGFETSERCRNCGYDFSLLTGNMAATRTPDLPLREATPASSGGVAWDDGLRRSATPAAGELASNDPLAPMALDTVVTLAPATAAPAAAQAVEGRRAAARAGTSSLPLFHPGADDEPLIKLPVAPRPPLAVRRTPDKPRLRAVPKQARRATEDLVGEPDEPALTFADEPILTPSTRPAMPAVPRKAVQADAETSGSVRRLSAAAIDHAILLVIDLTVVYFTLKMAALTSSEWQQLPPVPLAAFLGLVKVAYFGAFTLVGGQTIGKMATRIRVVSDGSGELDAARAIQRTAVGAVSLLAAGIGFIPMLIAADRRGLHDRVARTRVVRS